VRIRGRVNFRDGGIPSGNGSVWPACSGGHRDPAVATVETTNPEDNVLGNVSGVVAMRSRWRVASMIEGPGLTSVGFFVMCWSNCSKMRSRYCRRHRHFREPAWHLDVSENEGAKTLADHGAHGGGHGSQLFGNPRALHSRRTRRARRDSPRCRRWLEVIGDFQSGKR